LEDPDFFIFILMKASKNSLLRKLVESQERGENIFEYMDIKRVISKDIDVESIFNNIFIPFR
jgi:hypothetical protein